MVAVEELAQSEAADPMPTAEPKVGAY